MVVSMYLMNTNVLPQICSTAILKMLAHGMTPVSNRFKIHAFPHAYRLVFEYQKAFYNTKRIHGHCDYMSLNDCEELYLRV